MGNSCPVCSRIVKSENPQKGEVSWETTYCSHYCRLFDERNLTKIPFKGGNKHHNNKLAWPKIKVKCDMCEKEATLKHDLERGNGKYCSKECWNKLKSCQKRKIHQTLNILHYLEHAYKYEGHKWIPPSIIAEKCSKQSAGFTRSSVGGLLKRWRVAGIIEAQLQKGASNSYHYRLNPQGLRGLNISEFVYKWNTMSYAERITFTAK